MHGSLASIDDALFNPHWGEQAILEPDNTLKISMVMQGITGPESREVWKPFFDFVKASAQDYTIVEELRAGARSGNRVVASSMKGGSLIHDPRAGVPKHRGWWKGDAIRLAFSSPALIPSGSPLPCSRNESKRVWPKRFLPAAELTLLRYTSTKGLAGASAEVVSAAKQTATNPLVANAFALVIIANADKPAYPGLPGATISRENARRDAQAVDRAIAELRKLVPHSGSYVSESNYFNQSWQEAFWGANYPRLQAVKAKYDPNGLFFVHHGVGSETWSADGFNQLARYRSSITSRRVKSGDLTMR